MIKKIILLFHNLRMTLSQFLKNPKTDWYFMIMFFAGVIVFFFLANAIAYSKFRDIENYSSKYTHSLAPLNIDEIKSISDKTKQRQIDAGTLPKSVLIDPSF